MRSLVCSGKVRDGAGIDSKRDWSEVKNVLGYIAYPGTLNLRLSHRLPELKGTMIYDGFFEVYPAKVGGIDCHVCGKHNLAKKRMVFIVAPVKLREALSLKNGDDVEVIV